MNTRLTVADCRSLLYSEVDPSDANSALFLPWLNEVSERYINSGKWKGAIVSTVFETSDGFVTLPVDFLGALGMRYDIYAGSPIYSQFHPYLELGPGNIDDTLKFPGILLDLGDGYPTQSDITTTEPGTIRIYCGGTDAGRTMRLYGIEEETGEPVFGPDGDEGEVITLAAPYVDSTKHYSKLTGVQRQTTKGFVTMEVVPSGGGTAYEISSYRPNETRPMYRRYQTGTNTVDIHLICQRRFVPMVNETDWVIPGNLSALRWGLKMRYQEERSEFEKAELCFQKGLMLLNQEAKAARAGVRGETPMNLFGDRKAIPWAS